MEPERFADEQAEVEVKAMAGVVAGLFVCAFVFVIREALTSPEEDV